MDGAVRALREGRLEAAAAAPLVVVCDALDVLGGAEVLHKLVADMAAAIAQQRAQAEALHALCFCTAPAQLRRSGVHATTDYCSDPYGWLPAHSAMGADATTAGTAAGRCCSLDEALAPHPSRRTCLVVDSLSAMMQRQGPLQALGLLARWLQHPSVCGVLALLHADLAGPQELSAVQALAAVTLQLQPLSGLQHQLLHAATGAPPHGALRCCAKRRTGRLRVERQYYGLTAGGGLQLLQPPPDFEVSVHALVAAASEPPARATSTTAQAAGTTRPPADDPQHQLAGAAGAAAAAASLQQAPPASTGLPAMVGSMRLGVSAAEAAARDAVVLPFEHQGQAAPELYAGDARDYLPAAAGGRGPGTHARAPWQQRQQQRQQQQQAPHGSAPPGAAGAAAGGLGHILYVRDSEEEHDSDEDPDDDLDI